MYRLVNGVCAHLIHIIRRATAMTAIAVNSRITTTITPTKAPLNTESAAQKIWWKSTEYASGIELRYSSSPCLFIPARHVETQELNTASSARADGDPLAISDTIQLTTDRSQRDAIWYLSTHAQTIVTPPYIEWYEAKLDTWHMDALCTRSHASLGNNFHCSFRGLLILLSFDSLLPVVDIVRLFYTWRV